MYIANGVTVTTMNVIGTAGWKDFPEGHRKNLFRFFMFYNSEFLETCIAAKINCCAQSKESFLEQKFECKEDGTNFEVNVG